jgi:hypothetical protein
MPTLLFRAIATTDPAISFNGRYLAAYLCPPPPPCFGFRRDPA